MATDVTHSVSNHRAAQTAPEPGDQPNYTKLLVKSLYL